MTDPIPSERFAGAVPALGSELRVYRDRLEYDPGGLGGLVRGPKTVAFEGVDLVLRRDGRLDRLLGAGSYDLIRSGEPTVRIHHVTDTDEAERALDGRVPRPRERVETADEAEARAALQQERVAWRRWPDDEPLPRTAVVTDPDLVERLTAEETVERPEVSRAEDARPSGVTATDFENGTFPGGGGGGDADFTGGTSRHSPGLASNEGGAEKNVGSESAGDM
ncbi:hypothetical protein C475_14898 [Halosimplex carlsbadense 2-9-1]|uniref:Uncharacterized protein n=1 Tax=Halosimplex carlsbadense 2-9-1 TaxID=797114 RepID=M0CNY7_9EURY|nr:hypothetical protein [Halosimplex carlsbadense]ELZ23569.1 hypothetical protein C475_14898 [Halosimplex carlsbadense 2-9-1]